MSGLGILGRPSGSGLEFTGELGLPLQRMIVGLRTEEARAVALAILALAAPCLEEDACPVGLIANGVAPM